MWPFKKREVQAFADYVETLDMPPCGDKLVHYQWVKSSEETRRCPVCAANIVRRQEIDDMNTLAGLIADKVNGGLMNSNTDEIMQETELLMNKISVLVGKSLN